MHRIDHIATSMKPKWLLVNISPSTPYKIFQHLHSSIQTTPSSTLSSTSTHPLTTHQHFLGIPLFGKSLEKVLDIYVLNSPHSPKGHSKTRFYLPSPLSTQPKYQTTLKMIALHKQYTNFSTKLMIFYLPHQVVNLSTPDSTTSLHKPLLPSLIPISILPKELD